MERFAFREYLDYEDGKLARLETTGGFGIPLNVFADDGSDLSLQPGTAVDLDIWGECGGVKVFADEEECAAFGGNLAPESLVPTGTFSLRDGQPQSPAALFSGRVAEVDTDDEATEDEPNYCLTVVVPDVTLHIFVHSDAAIKAGNYVRGGAWLYAVIKG